MVSVFSRFKNCGNAFRCILLGVLLSVFCTVVQADQNDPRLQLLFEQLQTIKDQESGNEITDMIWRIWRDHENEEINGLMEAGMEEMKSGNLHRLRHAVTIFDKVIEKDPDFAEGWNKRATAYFFLGKLDQSAFDVRQTLMLEPRHFGATAGLGLIFLQLEHYESALQAFQKALELNPHLIGPKQQIQRLKELLANDPV